MQNNVKIEKLQPKDKRSVFLFYGVKSNRHVCSQFLTNFLRSQNDFKDQLVPHDIRSIGRTWMTDQEISYEVAEACLSHVAGGHCFSGLSKKRLLRNKKRSYATLERLYCLLCSEFSKSFFKLRWSLMFEEFFRKIRLCREQGYSEYRIVNFGSSENNSSSLGTALVPDKHSSKIS